MEPTTNNQQWTSLPVWKWKVHRAQRHAHSFGIPRMHSTYSSRSTTQTFNVLHIPNNAAYLVFEPKMALSFRWPRGLIFRNVLCRYFDFIQAKPPLLPQWSLKCFPEKTKCCHFLEMEVSFAPRKKTRLRTHERKYRSDNLVRCPAEDILSHTFPM